MTERLRSRPSVDGLRVVCACGPEGAALCACGHTDYWHSDAGRSGEGECEHDGECSCVAFAPWTNVEHLSDCDGEWPCSCVSRPAVPSQDSASEVAALRELGTVAVQRMRDEGVAADEETEAVRRENDTPPSAVPLKEPK